MNEFELHNANQQFFRQCAIQCNSTLMNALSTFEHSSNFLTQVDIDGFSTACFLHIFEVFAFEKLTVTSLFTLFTVEFFCSKSNSVVWEVTSLFRVWKIKATSFFGLDHDFVVYRPTSMFNKV